MIVTTLIIILAMNFDFLNKLTHEHPSPPQPAPSQPQQDLVQPQQHFQVSLAPPKRYQEPASQQLNRGQSPPQQQLANSITKERSRKSRKTISKPKKIISATAKIQQGDQASFQPHIMAIFKDMLSISQRGQSQFLHNDLTKIQDSIERKVYIRQMSRCEEEYFDNNAAQHQSNPYIRPAIASLNNQLLQHITSDIFDHILSPHFKRKKPQDDDKKIDALMMIRQQESQLHDKIGELNVQLRESSFLDMRAKQVLDKEQFDVDNVKTKKAEEFVKQLQKQKQQKENKIQQMKERKRAQEEQMKLEKQIEEEKAKQERHLKLMEQFLQKQKAKKQKQERERVQKLNFQSFMKEYKQQKPLFKRREEQYEKQKKQEQRQRFKLLRTNQAKYEPLNVQTLDVHEEKYLQLKNEDRQRKKAELQLAKQEERMRKRQLEQNVYKGKYRYIMLQEMIEKQAKKKEKEQQKQAILAKKQAYSLEVKERYRPAIDPNKRHEIEQIINSHRGKKRKYMTPNRVAYSQRYSTISAGPAYSQVESQPDPKKDGKRYHRLFKQYIREKISRGQIKQKTEEAPQTVQARPDYLKQLRQKYSDRVPSKAARFEKELEKIKDSKDYRLLAIKAEQFEGKAKQREDRIRSLPHRPEDQAQLEEDYLCAIKAKMEIISNLD